MFMVSVHKWSFVLLLSEWSKNDGEKNQCSKRYFGFHPPPEHLDMCHIIVQFNIRASSHVKFLLYVLNDKPHTDERLDFLPNILQIPQLLWDLLISPASNQLILVD